MESTKKVSVRSKSTSVKCLGAMPNSVGRRSTRSKGGHHKGKHGSKHKREHHKSRRHERREQDGERSEYWKQDCGRRQKVLVACFWAGDPTNKLPTGLSWSENLSKNYKQYRLTSLLHGDCIKYGLRPEVYQSIYGVTNPFAANITGLVNNGVKVIVCHLCSTNDKYPSDGYLPGLTFTPFSIAFIIEQTQRGSITIFDAQLQPEPPTVTTQAGQNPQNPLQGLINAIQSPFQKLSNATVNRIM
jgi:intracellular sulfur oxidation DsrE/DsrF family protein